MLLAILADFGTVGASTAIGAKLNALAAHIAVFAEFIHAGGASLTAVLAKDLLLAAGLTVGAMVACVDGTFHTQLVGGTNIHTAEADAALLAEIAVYLAVALRTIGAMHALVNGASLAEDGTRFRGAVFTNADAFRAQHTLFTPALDFKVTAAALGAVPLSLGGTVDTQNAVTQVFGARAANAGTAITGAAFLAPQLALVITLFAFGAVAAAVYGTGLTHRVADLLVGTAIADFVSGAIRAGSTLDTQIHTGIALITVLTIGRAVDPILTVGAEMPRKHGQGARRKQAQHQYQCQQKTADSFRLFHKVILLYVVHKLGRG